MNAGRWLLLFIAIITSASAFALDNPDAPPRVAQFLARARPYEERLGADSTQPRLGQAADAYLRFLDTELNGVYSSLLRHLDARGQQALAHSQRNWIAYRNTEFDFIDTNWNRANFGSSSMLSRADYRAALVKQRVLTLLEYLQNYGE